ncbi:shikimate dehydrogenase [Allocatelliglobosispora scoriae]|uniref:Shikimate dehydrogenase n=1 Tax=Allocatelliglobosispora scoriae TaxID=643052 RepID=A0A841BVK3_9ACTN|nr:shikimate dehydrogenase [Allocatelliglobosispora scoriae]MBB5873127.1 shikimate dehydrogenase [Allocatelliglobosispora scoriae]
MADTTLRRAAVLGKPIAHSLSPVIHNSGYAAAGLTDWSYDRFECDEAGLPAFVAALDESWAGLSLTMPLKEAGMLEAAEISPVATALGACNTLHRRPDGSWFAENTDAPGIVDALASAGVTAVESVAVLGAGGTARAAIAAAAQIAKSVTAYARRPEAIEELARIAALLGIPLTAGDWSSLDGCAGADAVISTLPAGVADGLRPAWRPGTVVFDVVYKPWPTPFAAGAEAAGCRIVSGLDLLLCQAVHQFELFTGVTAPVAEMREALHEAARNRT